MTFAYPGWLGLIPVVVPLVLLLHVRRKRDVVVPSLVVWSELKLSSTPTPSRRRMPWRDPHLWLQLLAVLLLAVSAARPAVGSGATGHWIVLLDASLTMSATDVEPSRFNAALGIVADRWGTHRSSGLVSLLEVGSSARLIAGDWQAGAELGSVLQGLSPTAEAADWQDAAALAASMVGDESDVRVVVVTDAFGAPAAFDALAEVGIATDAIEVIRVGAGLVSAGISELLVETRGDRQDQWTASGTIVSTGLERSEVVEVIASFRPLGGGTYLPWASDDVRISGDGSGEFSIPLSLPGSGEVQVRVAAGDHLPADDTAAVVLRHDPIEVLLVGTAQPALLKALESYGELQIYTSETPLPTSEASTFDLVIVTDGSEPTPATSTLWLGAVPSSLVAAPRLDVAGESLVVGAHYLMADVDVTTLTVSKSQSLQVPLGAVPMLSVGDSTLAWARTTESGRQVAIGFSLDDTNWVSQVSFPAFIAAVIDWAAPRSWSHASGGCTVGKACDWPREAFAGGWELLDPAGRPVAHLPEPVSVSGDPLADAVWVNHSLDAGFSPRVAGTYRLNIAGGSIPLPVSTSPLARGPDVDTAHHTVRRGSAVPYWQWLAAAAIVVMAADIVLSLVRAPRPVRWRKRAPLALGVLALVAVVTSVIGAPLPSLGQEYAVVWVGREEPPADAFAGMEWSWVERTPTGRDSLGSTARTSGGLSNTLERAFASPRHSERLRVIVSEEPGDSLTAGEAHDLAAAAALSHASVDIVTPRRAASTESLDGTKAILQSVVIPERVQAGSRYSIGFEVVAAEEVNWRLEASLTTSFTEQIDGAPGPTTLVEATGVGDRWVYLELQAGGPGELTYQVALRADGRDAAELTSLSVQIGPPPSVLMVAAEGTGSGLQTALHTQGLNVLRVTPSSMPWTLDALREFDGIVLMNVAARDLASSHQALLERYVREYGRGLVIVGGRSAFGPGGYYATPLEEVSPLSARVTDEVPQVAMAFVLDRSGSMSGVVAGASRMDLAKAATLEAIGLLGDRSVVSIIVFDTEAHVVLPPTTVSDREAFQASLTAVSPAGGTSIYPGLIAAYELMTASTSATRHVVVMTDGLSQDGDFAGVLGTLVQAGITTSFVGVGDAADRQQLTTLANLSNGTLHMARDFRALPSLLAQEALMLSTSPIEEGTVAPKWSEGDVPKFLTAATDMPAMEGYVRTTAKPEATVHAYAGDDPLLASWRYGLGRVVAFTSDADGPWSQAWMELDGYSGAWAQLVRWISERAVRDPWAMRLGQRGHSLDVIVDVPIAPLEPRPPYLPIVTVRATDGGRASSRRLEWVGEMRAAASIEVDVDYTGSLTVSLEAVPELGLGDGVTRTILWPLPPAASLRSDIVPLGSLVEATGGDVYAHTDELETSAGDRRIVWRRLPEVWLLLALIAMLVALGLRYGVALRILTGFKPRWLARAQPA